MIGLHASALARLAAGAAFCVAAVALVAWVEREPATTAVVAPAAAAVTRVQLSVESTYAVSTWRVSVLGVAQRAESSDAYGWRGVVEGPGGEDVVVVGVAAASEAPHRGLRVRLGDGERVVWGAGDVVATGTLP